MPGAAFLLSQVGFHSGRVWERRLRSVHLDPRHAVLLRHLQAGSGRTQRELSRTMGIPASRMVALVDELEELGFVERQRNVEDRRAHALVITPAGRRMVATLMEISATHERELVGALRPAERARLIELLARVAADQGLAFGVHPGVAASDPPVTQPLRGARRKGSRRRR